MVKLQEKGLTIVGNMPLNQPGTFIFSYKTSHAANCVLMTPKVLDRWQGRKPAAIAMLGHEVGEIGTLVGQHAMLLDYCECRLVLGNPAGTRPCVVLAASIDHESSHHGARITWARVWLDVTILAEITNPLAWLQWMVFAITRWFFDDA
jgi:hypothetical protein